jgi:hypothetical protein
MALKQNEKTLIGVALLASGIALVVLAGLPQWDLYNTQNSQVTILKTEKEALQTQKEALTLSVNTMEQNANIPLNLKIATYTDATREKMIKQLLDHVVSLSSQTGNTFISLMPTAEDDKAASEEEAKEAEKTTATGTEGKTAGTDPTATETPKLTAEEPVLNTFQYDLAVRGNYDTLQRFLKLVDHQGTLIAFNRLSLENELTSQAQSGKDLLLDPTRPVKMTVNIHLALQHTQ